MDRFRRLFIVALVAGAAAGLLQFALQQWLVIPLLATAETYEDAAHYQAPGASHSHDAKEDTAWEPSPGLERTALTAITTMLTGIGFAAMLLAAMVSSDKLMSAPRGALWGLAGFACFVFAPALGLPPLPPGAAVGDLYARQAWWFGTVAATGLGLWLACEASRPWPLRILGLICLVLPHLVPLPATAEASVVPDELVKAFGLASVLTNGVFWVMLGTFCGSGLSRQADRPINASSMLPL